MIEEEGLEVLASVVAPLIALTRKTGYFETAQREANKDPMTYLTYAGFWRPTRRLLAKKNARFWPLMIEEMRHVRSRKYFEAHGMNRLVGQMTNSDIRFLKKFLTNNFGIYEKEAARKLKDSYICSPARIKRIVRTENHRCRNGGDLEYELEKGVVKYKIWHCVSDPASRKSHVKRHKEKRLLNEPFTGGVMFPGDGPASEVVNCRCRLTFAVE